MMEKKNALLRDKRMMLEGKAKRLLLLLVAVVLATAIQAGRVTSPNGNLQAQAKNKKLTIKYKSQKVLELADIQFGKLKFVKKVTNDYQMLAGMPVLIVSVIWGINELMAWMNGK
jgi:hypothetical protein